MRIIASAVLAILFFSLSLILVSSICSLIFSSINNSTKLLFALHTCEGLRGLMGMPQSDGHAEVQWSALKFDGSFTDV